MNLVQKAFLTNNFPNEYLQAHKIWLEIEAKILGGNLPHPDQRYVAKWNVSSSNHSVIIQFHEITCYSMLRILAEFNGFNLIRYGDRGDLYSLSVCAS